MSFRKGRFFKVALAGAILVQALVAASCSHAVVKQTSNQPSPSQGEDVEDDIDVFQIKNISIEVDLWSCEDTEEKKDREGVLFREALRTFRSRFPDWNILDHPARPSAKDNRYSFDVSVDCCGVDDEGTPGFCLDVRIWSPDGNHWHKYASASRDIEGDDFGKVITTVNNLIENLALEK